MPAAKTTAAKAKIVAIAPTKIASASAPVHSSLQALISLYDVGGGAITIAADGTISIGGRPLTELQHQQIGEHL